MPAYFIYVCQDVTDRKELETYWAKVAPTLAGYEVKNIVGYAPFEQLEGDQVEGVAVVEFASFELAKAWYDSPAYRAIRHHRTDNAKYIGLLAEGGSLPPAQRMPQTKDRHR